MRPIETYHLRRKPPRVRPDQYRKYVAIKTGGLAAAIVQSCLVVLFLYLDASTLALAEMACILVCGVALWANRNGRHALAIYSIGAELIAHSFLTVSVLGAGSGFHFYLWPLACVAAINPDMRARQAAVIGYTCIALFAYLQLRYGQVPYPLANADYLPLLYFANVMVAAFPLILAVVQVRNIYEAQETRLTAIAVRDSLTGLYNRRFANEFLSKSFASHDRMARDFCIALGDLDHFKPVNDRYGHTAGDRVLEAVAGLLEETFRQSDCLCRWGGEEFMIALPETGQATAHAALDRFRHALANHPISVNGHTILVTMSFGLVRVEPGETPEETIKRADSLLYQAKNLGRDQVAVMPYEVPLNAPTYKPTA